MKRRYLDDLVTSVAKSKKTVAVKPNQKIADVIPNPKTTDVHPNQITTDVHPNQITTDVHPNQTTTDVHPNQTTVAANLNPTTIADNPNPTTVTTNSNQKILAVKPTQLPLLRIKRPLDDSWHNQPGPSRSKFPRYDTPNNAPLLQNNDDDPFNLRTSSHGKLNILDQNFGSEKHPVDTQLLPPLQSITTKKLPADLQIRAPESSRSSSDILDSNFGLEKQPGQTQLLPLLKNETPKKLPEEVLPLPVRAPESRRGLKRPLKINDIIYDQRCSISQHFPRNWIPDQQNALTLELEPIPEGTLLPGNGNNVSFKPTHELQTVPIKLRLVEARSASSRYSLRQTETYDAEIHKQISMRYSRSTLNAQQRVINDWACNQPTEIAQLQAGPGCGKSHTLLTIATQAIGDVVIYKNDLLNPFALLMRRYSIARLGMHLFDVVFGIWRGIERSFAKNYTQYEFILVVLGMLRHVELPNWMGGIVLLDEYTIMPKPMLVVLLIILEHYQIGTLMCGDRNQLQNIFNSQHAPLSAFELGLSFAKKNFFLTENIRCLDKNFSELIELISTEVSEAQLDDFAYAMLAAIFPNQLLTTTRYNQTHLAMCHADLSWQINTLVLRERIDYTYYLIDQSQCEQVDPTSVLIKPVCVQMYEANNSIDPQTNKAKVWVGKFLPYLPLQVGATYYVFIHSEESMCTLLDLKYVMSESGVNMLDHLIVRLHRPQEDGSTDIRIDRQPCERVIFAAHLSYIKSHTPENMTINSTSEKGRVVNFPIYPANIMTLYKSQGMTIDASQKVNLNMMRSTYRGMYVGISRVRTMDQIEHLTIDNPMMFLLATVMNFPEYVQDPSFVMTRNLLQTRMTQYGIYVSRPQFSPTQIYEWVTQLFTSDSKIERQTLYNQLVHSTIHTGRVSRNRQQQNYPNSNSDQYENTEDSTIPDNLSMPSLRALALIVRHRDIMKVLASMPEYDTFVWLHEWLLANPGLLENRRPALCYRQAEANAVFQILDGTLPTTPTIPKVMHDTVLTTQIANLNAAYDINTPTIEYLHQLSIVASKSIAPTLPRACLINTNMDDPTLRYAPSAFCARVYRKYMDTYSPYKNDPDRCLPTTSVCSNEWLYQQCHEIMNHTPSDKQERSQQESLNKLIIDKNILGSTVLPPLINKNSVVESEILPPLVSSLSSHQHPKTEEILAPLKPISSSSNSEIILPPLSATPYGSNILLPHLSSTPDLKSTPRSDETLLPNLNYTPRSTPCSAEMIHNSTDDFKTGECVSN